jgi:hypothetical protein
MEGVDVEWMISGASADVTMEADGGGEGTGKQKGNARCEGKKSNSQAKQEASTCFPNPKSAPDAQSRDSP